MGRKKEANKRSEILSTRLTLKESSIVHFVSNILGISIAGFISMCIQEWILNHSDFIKMVNKELNNESRRD